MPRVRPELLACCLLVLFPAVGRAQESVQGQEEDLAGTIEELKKRIDALEEDQELELEDLRLQVESLERELAAARLRAQTTQRNNVFNPAITVIGNFLGRVDDRPVYLEDDPMESRIDDRMNLREVEIDFRAAIDPWADGVVIVAFEAEEPNDYHVVIEEGYVVLKQLPVLDRAPAGLKLKAGRFRPDFGRFNKVHLHDLPQPQYPRSLRTFLGEEGYVQNGVSGQFFLPSPSESQTLEATLEVLDGGDVPIAESQSGSNLAALGHLKWFAELGGPHNLELGGSAWQSDTDHRLYGVDATYKWKPYQAGAWRSFLLGGELFLGDLDDPALASDPLGFYVWSQYQFNKNVYLGVLYDHAEDLEDASLDTHTVGAYLTYYTTEFLRFRIGYEHTESDDPVLDDVDTGLLELNFVFGSHPAEPYWVNR